MMRKDLTAKLLSAVMAGTMLFTACGMETAAPAVEAEPAAPGAAEETADVQETASAEWTGDIEEIEIVLFDIANGNEGTEPIVEAANAITEKTIGVHATFNYIPFGEYITQLNLIMTSGEPVDIINFTALPGTGFTQLMANGQLMDITDYMEEDGKEVVEMMGDYLSAGMMDGRIYGVPTFRSYGSSSMLIFRDDALEAAGMLDKARTASSFSDIEEILAGISENTTMSPIGGGQAIVTAGGTVYPSDLFSDAVVFDALGDTQDFVYNDNGEISLLPELEGFRAQMEMVRRWYDNGWVYKDSVLESTDPTALITNGTIAGMMISGEIGAEESWSDRLGTKVTGIELAKNLIRSSSIANFGLAVPVTADEPEAAVRWINELYTNPELENILCWGIEGEDYVVNEGVAHFPEGVSAPDARYHKTEFAYGNYFNLLPWEGNSADFRELAWEYMENFTVSPYMGFTADLSELSNTIAALSTTKSKYKGDIYVGTFTDEEYENYIAELNTAGVQDYLQAFRDQLDAYLAK